MARNAVRTYSIAAVGVIVTYEIQTGDIVPVLQSELDDSLFS